MLKIYAIKIYAKILWLFLTPKTRKFKIDGQIEDVFNIPYTNSRSKSFKLDVHFLKDTKGLKPVLVNIHGGGWTIMDKSVETGFARKLADMGYVVVNINYGLGLKYLHPDPLKHVTQALGWVSENCAKYHGDANKIFLMGDSAGAHLASLAACAYADDTFAQELGIKTPIALKQLKGLILFFGAYNFETILDSGFPLVKESVTGYIGTADIHAYPKLDQVSPIKHLSKDYPPVFITSGAVDPLHGSQTLAFIDALNVLNIPNQTLLFDKTVKEGAHGYSAFAENPCSAASLSAISKFISDFEEYKNK